MFHPRFIANLKYLKRLQKDETSLYSIVLVRMYKVASFFVYSLVFFSYLNLLPRCRYTGFKVNRIIWLDSRVLHSSFYVNSRLYT